MATRDVDPPNSAAHVGEGQTEAFEIVGAEALPGYGLLRPVPVGGDPAGARATERTIAVVDKQRCRIPFHHRTVAPRRRVAGPWYAPVVLRLTRPSVEDLTRLLAKATAADLSYSEAGATRGSPLPSGWEAHVGTGVEIVPSDARLTVGATVLLVIKTVGLWVAAPCRVVDVDHEPNRFSFADGTLPGHPEQGEVAMIVERNEIEGVVFRIVSFSRTVDPLARLGSPVTRLVQR